MSSHPNGLRRARLKAGVASLVRRVGEAGERGLARGAVALRTRLRGSCRVPRKAALIFKDYVLDLYYPVHRLSWRDRLRCTPLLLLIEYLVYRVDAVTERLVDEVARGRARVAAVVGGRVHAR